MRRLGFFLLNAVILAVLVALVLWDGGVFG
jgi:hypothetical protein